MKKFFAFVLTLAMFACTFGPVVPASAADSGISSAQPVIKKITTSNCNPQITWQAVEGASSYRLYRKTATDKKYKKVCDTAELSYTDENWDAEEGTKISYKVKALFKTEDGKTWSKYSAVKKWKVKIEHLSDTDKQLPEQPTWEELLNMEGASIVGNGAIKVPSQKTSKDEMIHYYNEETGRWVRKGWNHVMKYYYDTGNTPDAGEPVFTDDALNNLISDLESNYNFRILYRSPDTNMSEPSGKTHERIVLGSNENNITLSLDMYSETLAYFRFLGETESYYMDINSLGTVYSFLR